MGMISNDGSWIGRSVQASEGVGCSCLDASRLVVWGALASSESAIGEALASVAPSPILDLGTGNNSIWVGRLTPSGAGTSKLTYKNVLNGVLWQFKKKTQLGASRMKIRKSHIYITGIYLQLTS